MLKSQKEVTFVDEVFMFQFPDKDMVLNSVKGTGEIKEEDIGGSFGGKVGLNVGEEE